MRHHTSLRAGAVGRASHAVLLRHARAAGRHRHHAGHQRQRSGLGTAATNAQCHIPTHSIRDRLDRDARSHGSQVMWRFGRSGFSPSAAMTLDAFSTMDAWLSTLAADAATTTTRAQKMLGTKPAAATDWCYLSNDAAQSTKVSDAATCNADFYLQPRSSPRQVAGSPRTEDILKCQLRPVKVVEYGGRLSVSQLTRLQAVFVGGVCDWSKPGVGQQAAIGPLNFKAGPGGVALGDAPVSRAR